MIPLLEPAYIPESMAYVLAAITDNNVAIGPHIQEFEDRISAHVGTKHAVSVSSGTAALHLAMMVSPVAPGDEVIVPVCSFVASANVVRYVGAHPWFVDIDEYAQLDVGKVFDFLKHGCRRTKSGKFYNKETGRKVSAIMAVHMLGHPVTNMDTLIKIAREAGLFVIEDCAQGFGASWKNKAVGSFGDIACFSFNGNKIITCGGGGMVTTDSDIFAQEVRNYANQGKTPIEQSTFWHDKIGYNYRMPNLLAAVGVSQLEHLDKIITKKRTLREMYDEYLPIPVLEEHTEAFSTYWLNLVISDHIETASVIMQVREKGIEVRHMYTPMHIFPMYKGYTDAARKSLAASIYNHSLLVPSSVSLDLEKVKEICSTIKEVL